MKFSFFLLCVGLAVSAGAQVKVGIYAGPQITTAYYKVNDAVQPTSYKYGLQAGINLKVPVEGRFYFSPSVYYNTKGYKVTFNDRAYPPGVMAKNNNTRIHTLEIAPLFTIDLSNHPSHFFVQFGPSLDFVLSGREKFDLDNGTTVDQKMKIGFADYGYATSSAIARLGWEAGNGFIVFAHYGFGLGSANNADLGPSIKHRVAGISIGKYLGKKSK